MSLTIVPLVLAIALAIIQATGAHAKVDCTNPPPDYTSEDIKAPMRFFYPEGNACFGNAVNNPYIAVGVINNDTPSVFLEFMKSNPPVAPLEFTSPGGSLLAALKLGEMIRKGGYDTSLGKECASACAYAVLGGVHRYVAQRALGEDADYDNRNVGATGTKLGVHQFYQNDALNDLQKKAFSAIDKSVDQLLMGILLEYTMRMGVHAQMVQAASSIPPWQEIRWLTQKEMIAWKVDNSQRQYTNLTFSAFGRTGSYVTVSNVRGFEASTLRIFCRKGIEEPLFAFVTEQKLNRPEGISEAAGKDELKKLAEYTRALLTHLTIRLDIANHKSTPVPFDIYDVQVVQQSSNVVRIFAVVRAIGLSRREAEGLTRVALVDNGELARSEWTVQDWLKFRIQGDHRLIALAMKNCVN